MLKNLVKNLVAILVLLLAISINAIASSDLDTSYSGGRFVSTISAVTNGNSLGNSVLIQPDGKAIASGYGRGVNVKGFALRRFNTDGTIDTAYGNGGNILEVSSGPTFFDSFGLGMAMQPSGKVVMVGYINFNGTNVAEVTRFNTDGTFDTTFATNGLFTANFNGNAQFSSVALQSDGKIVAAGTVSGNFLVARFSADGVIDTTFGNGGFITTDFSGGNDTGTTLVINPSGQILVGGRTVLPSVTGSSCAVAAFTSSGVLDTTFGTGGKVITDVAPSNGDTLNRILLQSDGKIVGLGFTANVSGNGINQLVLRYNANGSLDTSFGTNGITSVSFGSTQQVINSGLILPNGKIFAVGYAADRVAISRFNADGTLDRTYGCNGAIYSSSNFTGATHLANDAAIQPDGKVVVTGGFRFSTIEFVAMARFSNKSSRCNEADFDRDGYSDFSVFRPSTGNWHILNSIANTNTTLPFGLSTDKLTPADFDGDGRTDYAVWREAPANQAAYYILQSTNNTVRTELFGQTGDKPNVVGDWDGDGKADPAVYRNAAFGNQSYFFYRGSNNNPSGNITFVPWGTNGDEGLRGDFDGDGKQDAAVYRPSNSTWYVQKSSDSSLLANNWGLNTDKRLEGDFDGDRKTDFAVFRPSDTTWYIQKSSDNQLQYLQFGLSTDQLTPADYDGDGKTDIAVFRNGTWYVQQSINSTLTYGYFGTSGDTAIPTSFIP